MGVQPQIPFSDGGAYSWLVEHPVGAFAFLVGLRRVFMPVNVVGAHEAGIVRAANKSFEQEQARPSIEASTDKPSLPYRDPGKGEQTNEISGLRLSSAAS